MNLDPRCPAWWAARTTLFGRMLEEPLEVVQGTFTSTAPARSRVLLESVVPRSPGAAARLAIYHEQGWKRLFVTLQESFPRTARLLGAHRFNRAVALALSRGRRSSQDLADVAEPFVEAVEDAMRQRGDASTGRLASLLGESSVAPSALRSAVRLDEAERRAFRAPIPRAAVDPAQARRACDARPDARVRLAPSFSLIRVEHAVIDPGRLREGPVGSLRVPGHVTVVATTKGVTVRCVDPVFARLLALASELPIGLATSRTRASLDARLVVHFDRSKNERIEEAFERGYWIGLLP